MYALAVKAAALTSTAHVSSHRHSYELSIPSDVAGLQGRRCSLASASSGASSWSRPSSSRYSAGGKTPSRGQRGFGGPRRDCELCELHDAAGRLCKKVHTASKLS